MLGVFTHKDKANQAAPQMAKKSAIARKKKVVNVKIQTVISEKTEGGGRWLRLNN